MSGLQTSLNTVSSSLTTTQSNLKTLYAIETVTFPNTTVPGTSSGTSYTSIDVAIPTKAGYTPIGFVRFTTGTAYLVVAALYINSSGQAHLTVKNTASGTSTCNGNAQVLYLRTFA